jgi:hypothetical protein
MLATSQTGPTEQSCWDEVRDEVEAKNVQTPLADWRFALLVSDSPEPRAAIHQFKLNYVPAQWTFCFLLRRDVDAQGIAEVNLVLLLLRDNSP